MFWTFAQDEIERVKPGAAPDWILGQLQRAAAPLPLLVAFRGQAPRFSQLPDTHAQAPRLVEKFRTTSPFDALLPSTESTPVPSSFNFDAKMNTAEQTDDNLPSKDERLPLQLQMARRADELARFRGGHADHDCWLEAEGDVLNRTAEPLLA